MAKKAKVDAITLTYDLPSLPTAQHKAGLAGLLLTVDAMRKKGIAEVPEISDLNQLGFSITFTEKTLQAVFDELYDASWEERRKKEEKTEDKVESKKNKKNVVETAVVVPKLGVLEVAGLSDKEEWLKLWREASWNILRAIPATQGVYKDRAEGRHTKKALETWTELTQQIACAKKETVKVPSNLYLGAQEWNAERVLFQGTADQTLLLHFWLLCSLVYIPKIIDVKGKESEDGYVLAVPEVSRLIEFLENYAQVLGERKNEIVGKYSPRPKDALISIPEEGGLDYLSLLIEKTRNRVKSEGVWFSVSAVEVFHFKVIRTGIRKTVSMRSSYRLEIDPNMVSDFEYVRGSFTNLIFRAQFIRNKIRSRPWFEGFCKLAAKMPVEWFINTAESPWIARRFCADARKAFKERSL